ncbi:helix-turn-helix domain-containing protein [Roseobacter weihaiensis]|uniref:helix-turn-helix domain-containing protein n=1 Tax=Roseobacter weihaiensis TaxID=2763262 RepID=UPI001D0ACCCF|nr:helix-turn-helix domain-containing protein [Roseobacter sp. H9]
MSSIPSYELYGEFLSGAVPDPVHHETIKERSSKHDWTIRLHRHRRLAQIFLFRSPGVFFRLGDIEFTTNQPMILVAPPGIPHGFLFSEDVNGDVLSIRLDEMPRTIQQRFGQFSAQTDTFFLQNRTHNFKHVADLFVQMEEIYHRPGTNRSDILTALVDLIVTYLIGNLRRKTILGQAPFIERRDRKDLQAEAFCTLLEANFQKAWSVADYAGQLGVSAPHLTRICRAVLGAPPNELVRQRRILEAKRLLEYTALSITEITHRCGFRDAAFFSRAFKSVVGTPPKIYRQSVN